MPGEDGELEDGELDDDCEEVLPLVEELAGSNQKSLSDDTPTPVEKVLEEVSSVLVPSSGDRKASHSSHRNRRVREEKVHRRHRGHAEDRDEAVLPIAVAESATDMEEQQANTKRREKFENRDKFPATKRAASSRGSREPVDITPLPETDDAYRVWNGDEASGAADYSSKWHRTSVDPAEGLPLSHQLSEHAGRGGGYTPPPSRYLGGEELRLDRPYKEACDYVDDRGYVEERGGHRDEISPYGGYHSTRQLAPPGPYDSPRSSGEEEWGMRDEVIAREEENSKGYHDDEDNRGYYNRGGFEARRRQRRSPSPRGRDALGHEEEWEENSPDSVRREWPEARRGDRSDARRGDRSEFARGERANFRRGERVDYRREDKWDDRREVRSSSHRSGSGLPPAKHTEARHAPDSRWHRPGSTSKRSNTMSPSEREHEPFIVLNDDDDDQQDFPDDDLYWGRGAPPDSCGVPQNERGGSNPRRLSADDPANTGPQPLRATKFRNRDPLPTVVPAPIAAAVAVIRAWDERDSDGDKGEPLARKRKMKLVDTPLDERPVCKFFLEKKCIKGHDCPFKHPLTTSSVTAKRPDLCKYYLHGVCHRRNTCVFYHEDWPCKGFHNNGGNCSYGTACKLSHEPLTDATRKILEAISGDDGPPPAKRPHTGLPASANKAIPNLLDLDFTSAGSAPPPPPYVSPSHRRKIIGFYDDKESDSSHSPRSTDTPTNHGAPAKKRSLLGDAPSRGPSSQCLFSRSHGNGVDGDGNEEDYGDESYNGWDDYNDDYNAEAGDRATNGQSSMETSDHTAQSQNDAGSGSTSGGVVQQSVEDLIKSFKQQQQQQAPPPRPNHGVGLLPSPPAGAALFNMHQPPPSLYPPPINPMFLRGIPPPYPMHGIPPLIPPPGMGYSMPPPPQMVPPPILSAPPLLPQTTAPPPPVTSTPSQMSSCDIGNILSFIRGMTELNNAATSVPMSSASSAVTAQVKSEAQVKNEQYETTPAVLADTLAAMPASITTLSASLPNVPDPRRRVTSDDSVKPTPTHNTRSPPTQTPQSPEDDSSLEVFAGIGRITVYALRVVVVDKRPTIPSHVSLEDLERRKDPRLKKYSRELTSGGSADTEIRFKTESVGVADVRVKNEVGGGFDAKVKIEDGSVVEEGAKVLRGGGRTMIPWSEQDKVQIAVEVARERERRASRTTSPPHTLPDIILPPLPISLPEITGLSPASSQRTPQSNGRTRSIRPEDTKLPDRQPVAFVSVKSESSTLTQTIKPAIKVKVPEALLERNYLPDIGLSLSSRATTGNGGGGDATEEVKVVKKVIDYRNDPRYKKKKTRPSTEDGPSAAASSTTGVASDTKQVSKDSSPDTALRSDSIESFSATESKMASSGETNQNNRGKGHYVSPQTPTTPSNELIHVPSFLVTNRPTLIGASGHDIDDDDEDDDDEDLNQKLSLKDMFKTIDPTTSPFC